jgi:hypothetical protein
MTSHKGPLTIEQGNVVKDFPFITNTKNKV